MQKKESTHIIFDGKQIRISKNLREIFKFLSDVSKEIEDLLSLEMKIVNIQEGYKNLLDFSKTLLKIVEQNNLEFNTDLSMKDIEDSLTLFQDFRYPIRSTIIALFSYIEVLYCIDLAYQNSISDPTKILSLSNDKSVKKFITQYILNENNSFYKANKQRFSKITSKNLRQLRNLLVHFFSTNAEISIHPTNFEKKARIIESEFEKSGQNNFIFLSSNDLYNLIKDSSELILIEWTNDFQSMPEQFKDKIFCVKKLITEIGSVIIPDSAIKINKDN
ncbi:MAG: hypothetical protein KAT68_13435 [Bacteroidales bacterium]|nr:hypothetical protein [Bacteroidales bacterium]